MSASDDLHSKIEQSTGKEWISCPICGNQDWLVWPETPMTYLPLASARALDLSIEGSGPEEEDYPGSSHFVQATCERCGFLRLHDIHVVLADQPSWTDS
jgi:predicted nucleic-acid-binding Zn-ribbon protein